MMKYRDRIYPNVYLGDLNLGGLTVAEAELKIKTKAEQLLKNGVEFNYQGKKINLASQSVSTTDPDLTREIITFNSQESLRFLGLPPFPVYNGRPFL